MPALGAIAIVLMIWRRPRAAWPYLALAAVLALTVAGTWYGSQRPIRQLADRIE